MRVRHWQIFSGRMINYICDIYVTIPQDVPHQLRYIPLVHRITTITTTALIIRIFYSSKAIKHSLPISVINQIHPTMRTDPAHLHSFVNYFRSAIVLQHWTRRCRCWTCGRGHQGGSNCITSGGIGTTIDVYITRQSHISAPRGTEYGSVLDIDSCDQRIYNYFIKDVSPIESQQPTELSSEPKSNHGDMMANFFAQPDELAYVLRWWISFRKESQNRLDDTNNIVGYWCQKKCKPTPTKAWMEITIVIQHCYSQQKGIEVFQ